MELAEKAEVGHLCLFHLDPISIDQDLDKFLQDTSKLVTLMADEKSFKVSIARDGMEINL